MAVLIIALITTETNNTTSVLKRQYLGEITGGKLFHAMEKTLRRASFLDAGKQNMVNIK